MYCWAHWSRTVDRRCCSFLRCSSFCNFIFMETISNHAESCSRVRSQSPKGDNLCRWSIYCNFSQAESQSNLYMYGIYGYSVHREGDICSYCNTKFIYEWTIRSGTSSLYFSIRPIKRGTIKVVPGTCQLDCVWLRQCHVYWWIKICSWARW